MTLTRRNAGLWKRSTVIWLVAALMAALVVRGQAQGVTTTTVQGTVYLATGQPGAGTLVVKWPAFTTAAGEAITADSVTARIGSDGFVSVSLAPNQGATPAGLFYTAVYYLSDGSSSTEYWVVPATAQATLAQVRTQVMPAAQAVQAVTKTYVDEQVSELSQSLLSASGGNLSGPLYLNGDPTQDLQAADKRYVDTAAANAWPGAVLRADHFAGGDFGAQLQACVNAVSTTYGGTCDARNFSGNLAMTADLTVPAANTNVLLPCATITTAYRILVPAGVRNVALHGCAHRGGSASSGSAGGTAFAYSGASALVQVGDPTYATDTPGFHMDNVVIDTTASSSAVAEGLAAYRTQELDLEGVYFLGNSNQTGMTLDGTGNYTGGTFLDDQLVGFQTAVNGIGHQTANGATTDWLNASTFIRVHIDCPTSNGAPVAGTYGINLQQGDGNTFTGGDVENCSTALHLGANAQNNTIVGLRNENSTYQVVADAGSSYNNWITGGTMFTGKLVDNGTRNSFLDTFHRSFNALNGDWYGSQQDATLTNHYRLGTGAGNERGLLDRYQTDSGYRWTMGLSDATGGEQYYQLLDELNSVYRISVGQYNSGQASTNDQTVVNAAGTGAVVLNGSNNAGTGGVVIGSGGPNPATVATISNAGNAQFNGTLQVAGTSQSTGTMTVRNNADAEVDYYLWPGLTTSQKGSFTYKDFNGNSQWFMVKDQNNNWALNSAVGGLDSFKAYQSTNSGDTYVNAANPSGAVRVNYENGSGGSFKVYGGNSSTPYASFTAANAIAFPGLAASSGHNCLQIDSSGYITNTGAACVTGGAAGTGTIESGSSGQIAYYNADGTVIGGTSSVPLSAGGTGATTAAGALQNLGALAQAGGTMTGQLNGTDASFSGNVAAGAILPDSSPIVDIRSPAFNSGTVLNCGTLSSDLTGALNSAIASKPSNDSAIIEIVGTIAHPCYMKYPTQINWGNQDLTLRITGPLYVEQSLALPTNGIHIHMAGYGGAYAQGAQQSVYPAELALDNSLGAQMGTLGTPISTTAGTPVTATFTPPAMGALANGDYITITDPVNCTVTTATLYNNVATLQLNGACHIPPGARGVVVSGVANPIFNGTVTITASDFNLNTVSYALTGSNTASTGGTVTGVNEDTLEDVGPLTNCTSTSCQATFYRSHAANATWGVAAVVLSQSDNISNISIGDYSGSPLIIHEGYQNLLQNDGFDGVFPVSVDATSYPQFEHDAFNVCQTGNTNYTVPWSIHFWNHSNSSSHTNSDSSSDMQLNHSWICSGVLMDWGAQSLTMQDPIMERSQAAMVTLDGTYSLNLGISSIVSIEGGQIQDPNLDSVGIYYPYPGTGQGQATRIHLCSTTYGPSAITNDYFDGTLDTCDVSAAGMSPPYGLNASWGVQGTYNDGRKLAGEWDGTDASLGPVMIPYKTMNIPQDPASWGTYGGVCTITPGVLGPNGTTSPFAAQISSTGSCQSNIAQILEPFHLYDYILFGGWTLEPRWAANSGSSGAYAITTANSTHYKLSYLPNTGVQASEVTGSFWDSGRDNDWWHVQSGLAMVSQADGTNSYMKFNALASSAGAIEDYYRPWLIYVPAVQLTATLDGSTSTLTSVSVSSGTLAVGMEVYGAGIAPHSFITAISGSSVTLNQATYTAGTGVALSAQYPYREVNRWRTYLLHGGVPPNAPAGIALTTSPIGSVPDSTTITGTSGTAVCSQGLQGTQKYASCFLNGYAQTGTAQTYTFPTPYNTTPVLLEGGGSCGSYNPSVSATALTLPADASMTAESCNVVVLGQ